MRKNPESEQPREPRLLLSPEEAADLCGVSRRKMFSLIASGEVRSFKLGASRKVPRSELTVMIDRKMAEELAQQAAS